SWSAAIGYNAEASGIYSTALGPWVSTNGQKGACIIGDNSVETPGIPTERTTSTAPNQMMMRFDGGYVFYTKGDLSAGATLDAGQSSWSVLSDSTRKYAFLAVDGEEVLEKISRFNLRSWSYKGQDITRNRHYGPMAQEFFNAFGHDKYGTAGNDSTINQADFDGINLIAIQALEKRTRELHKAREKITELEQKIQEQNARLAAMENRFTVIEAKLREQAHADRVHLDDALYLVQDAEGKE
ncbi:hypothetical protein JW992_04490, partial [candidate division KSB1 bacterium]|nr:hypothetical protein [candidate division KSB1 bacterium]